MCCVRKSNLMIIFCALVWNHLFEIETPHLVNDYYDSSKSDCRLILNLYSLHKHNMIMSIYRNGMFYGRYGVWISIFISSGFCCRYTIHSFRIEGEERGNYLKPDFCHCPFSQKWTAEQFQFHTRTVHGVRCMTNTWLWIIK